jgi:hypothetical protein
MSVTVVLPSIDPEYTRACIATMRFVDPKSVPVPTRQVATDIFDLTGESWHDGKPDVRLVVVYNTPEFNTGVAGAWNVGIEKMYEHGHGWLVILSAGVRFGKPGGMDLIRFLGEARAANPSPMLIEAGRGLGWHCLAFSRKVLDLVGPFDPQFYPAYGEDLDWSVRFQRMTGMGSKAPGFVGPLWPKVDIDAELIEVAHGIKRGGVTVDLVEMNRRFHAKWGENEEYRTPYNDPSLDFTYVGPPVVLQP